MCLFVLLDLVSCAVKQQGKSAASKESVKMSVDHVKSRPDQSIQECR